MKSPLHVLLIGAALCGGFNCARAQTAPDPVRASALPADQKKTMRIIRLKNVLPGLMAHWLDPKNSPLPIQFRGEVPKPGSALGDSLISPIEFERIVALDPQNALLVFGTETAVQEIEKLVEFLDKPLRQVEIETQWVQVSDKDAQLFGINYSTSQGEFNINPGRLAPASAPKSPFPLGFVRGNFQATLAQLVARDLAKVLVAPKIVAINNMPANVSTTTTLPGILGYQDTMGHFSPLLLDEGLPGINFRLAVTPTINTDDTVTLLMSTATKLKMTSEADNALKLSPDGENFEVIANVRDGDTIALTGYSSRLFSNFKAGSKPPAPNILVFVTPRIVRRAGDDIKTVVLKR